MKKKTQQIQRKIAHSIQKAWSFLEQEQQAKGNFIGLSFTQDGTKEKVGKTAFTTSLILNCLRYVSESPHIDTEGFNTLTSKATNYICSEKEEKYCIWNYWQKGEPLRKTLPGDMDDTSLAFASLKLWKPEVVDGEMLARLTHALIAAEVKTGGPYNTWITNFKKDKRWQDCDIAVNANIAYMLSLLGVTLPKLTSYFEKVLKNGEFSSKYYLSPITILYFISRSYRGKQKELFIAEIEKCRKPNGAFENPLITALALSALYYFGKDISGEDGQRSVAYLLSKQKTDGSWNKEMYYFEHGNAEAKWYHGADTLTTSACLEALCLLDNKYYENQGTEQSQHRQNSAALEAVAKIFTEKANIVSTAFGNLASIWSEKMLSHKWIAECILLPSIVSGQNVNKKITKLIEGGLSGWIGYSLLDDIMDGDEPKELIPFANFCIREMNLVYKAELTTNAYSMAQDILNKTDKAYFDEQNRRIKGIEFAILLDQHNQHSNVSHVSHAKSLGLVLGAIGATSDLQTQNALIIFYRHFLEAKQDSDDAEDLIQDLSRGHVSKVGAMVLLELQKQHPKQKHYSATKDKDTLLAIFWSAVFPKLYTEMSDNLRLALACINSMDIVNRDYFSILVSKLQKSISDTENDRVKVEKFISVY